MTKEKSFGRVVLIFIIFVILMIVDYIIPDPIPIVDELLLTIGSVKYGWAVIKGWFK